MLRMSASATSYVIQAGSGGPVASNDGLSILGCLLDPTKKLNFLPQYYKDHRHPKVLESKQPARRQPRIDCGLLWCLTTWTPKVFKIMAF